MLTFKRALIFASLLLSLFVLFRATHTPKPKNPKAFRSPRPTGTYEESIDFGDVPASQENNAPRGRWASSNAQAALVRKQRPQIEMEQLRLQPIRQQLSWVFPYDPDSRFPAYIWQTWKYEPSSGDFGDELRPGEASWTELHPSFVHEVITDRIAEQLVRHYYASIPEVQEAYAALPHPVLKADFFRYLILLARGGIYSDIDTAALKSAVEWVPAEVPRTSYGLVIGIEADPDRPDWHEWYSRRIQFCQWTIQAKPGHPVLVDIVAKITETTLKLRAAGALKWSSESAIEFTGPAVWTDSVFAYFNNPEFFDMSTGDGNITWRQFTGITQAKKIGDVIVLPITSFSPGVNQMNAGDLDDPMAFVQHAFEGSWKPESLRHIGQQL